jgi:UDP-N-acetylglucosamine 4,6-dehydratase
VDLAKAVAPDCKIEYSGIRPGEKIHEILVSEDEVRTTVETDDMFIVEPVHPWWKLWNWEGGKPMKDGFKYSSDSNSRWLSAAQLREMLTECKQD